MMPARWQPYLLATVATLGLAAFAAYDLFLERDRAVAQAKANTANLARLLQEHTRQSLRRVEALLNDAEARIADAMAAGPMSPELTALVPTLKSMLPPDGQVTALLWLAPDDKPLASTLPDADAPMLADWLARPHGSGQPALTVGRLWRSAAGLWQLPVGRRIKDRDGRAAGALLAVVNPKTLQPVLDAVDTDKNGFVTLFRADGWMLATAPANEALYNKNWSDAPMFKEHLPHSPAGTVRQVVARDNTERV